MNSGTQFQHKNNVAIVVAHPDDETLWCGGTILNHPEIRWVIISLCRGKDPDRGPKFFKTLKQLNAEGFMGDLNDGPEQKPLEKSDIQSAILNLLPPKHFDLIISHNPKGEYTRHIRHEETGKAVIELWDSEQIATDEYWSFAYQDGNNHHLPKHDENASIQMHLQKSIWKKKYEIITEIYGFKKDSWEARTTPKTEAFWQFTKPGDAIKWMDELNR